MFSSAVNFISNLFQQPIFNNAVTTNIENTVINEVAAYSTNDQKSQSNDNSFQNSINKISFEMNRRANSFYGLGYGIGIVIGTRKDDEQTSESKEIAQEKLIKDYTQITSEPFSPHFSKIFPEKTISILLIGVDPGVDDAKGITQLMAAKLNTNNDKKKIEINEIIPSVGNVDLPLTIDNTLKLLELTNNRNIKVYRGAFSPLAIENNITAIELMRKGINETHFYGYDGLSDIGGWPTPTMKVENTQGYVFAADKIFYSKNPLTLISTSSLPELAKTLTQLEKLDVEAQQKPGTSFKKINAVSLMGGCFGTMGCNAPFDVPNDKKNSEANFYFDADAAKQVFAICDKYQIPILLAPLDLTHQPWLLWTKKEVKILKDINNPVAKKMGEVTDVIPWIDALNFPNKTYPMHDLHAFTGFLYPESYNVKRMAARIGNVGEIIIKNVTISYRNVYVLEMPLDRQKNFYKIILDEYKNFSTKKEDTNFPLELLYVTLAVSSVICVLGCCISLCKKKYDNIDKNDEIYAPV